LALFLPGKDLREVTPELITAFEISLRKAKLFASQRLIELIQPCAPSSNIYNKSMGTLIRPWKSRQVNLPVDYLKVLTIAQILSYYRRSVQSE